MRERLILSVLFMLIGLFSSGSQGGNDTALNDDNSASWETAAANNVRSVIMTFLKAGTEGRFKMMSQHYQDVVKTPISIKNSFDKEAYEIGEFIEVKPFIAKKSKKHLAYVQVEVVWHFEGYDGRQTCHFHLIETNSVWRIDWFIC